MNYQIHSNFDESLQKSKMLSFTSRFQAMNFTKLFSKSHEYIDVDGNKGKLGISKFAAHLLGDVTFVDIEEGKSVKKMGEAGSIEASKAVSPIMAPVSLKIEKINAAVAENPEIVGKDPEGKGWIASVIINDESELKGLLSEKEYEQFIKNN